MAIIALSGKRGVGKTTSALYLKNHYGFHIRSFADPIRRISKEIFDFDESDFGVSNKEKPFKHYDFTPRDFMVSLGQFLRYHDKHYLTNELVKTLESSQQNYVIDDLRLLEELEILKKFTGITFIRIERFKTLNPYKESFDKTETELDTYPFTIRIEEPANTTLAELRRSLDYIMTDLGHKKK